MTSKTPLALCCTFSVAKATLESQMSVSPSISLSSIAQNAYIEPIDHRAYQPSSLSTIEPIDHQAYQTLQHFDNFYKRDHNNHRKIVFQKELLSLSIRGSFTCILHHLRIVSIHMNES